MLGEQVKNLPMTLMVVLVQQISNDAAMVIIVICLLTQKKYKYKFEANNKMSTFHLNFVQEPYLINFPMPSQEKYL